MTQRHKDAVCTLGTVFSIKHILFALLVRHSEWILNHLVHNDFLVELDNRVTKTSPYESHTGNPAPRSNSLVKITVFCSAIVIDVIVHCHTAGPF